ncbi:MAG: hypothetical protein PHO54_05820 [Candidatus Peribacteraceae bacterium]|nr:hypothetical protein [Candidatus Peribacteraceae bacterium]
MGKRSVLPRFMRCKNSLLLLCLVLVGCSGMDAKTEAEIKNYNATLHQQFFSMEVEIDKNMVKDYRYFMTPPYRSTLELEVENLTQGVALWSTLPVSGKLRAKRDAVASALTELREAKASMSEGRTWVKPAGITSITELEDNYLNAYLDFLKTAFPKGDVEPSFTAHDYAEALGLAN